MRFLATLICIVSLTGCDLIQKLENTRVIAATLIQSPSITANAGGVSVSATSETVAQVYLGDRDNDGNLTPVTGATVTVTWGANQVTLREQGNGYYEANSLDDGLGYTANATYTFSAVESGDTYWGTAVAPESTAISEFSGSAIWSEPFESPESQTITRTGSTDDTLGFYAVNAWDSSSNAQGEVKCTNIPTDAEGLVSLILDSSDWEATSFTLGSDCFPSAGIYSVALTNVSEGSDFSSNLFIASAILIGTSAGGFYYLY